jgi:Domain of unknown function (DUF4123)
MEDDIDLQADLLIRTFRQMAHAQGPHACLCVLIDPLLGNPLAELSAIEKLPIRPLRIQHDDLAQDEVPYLLKVGQEQDHERLISHTLRLALAEQRNALLESPASRSVCAWLFVDEGDLSKLVDALSQFARIPRPDGQGQRSLFRFWDPRVFQHLPRVMGQQHFERALADQLALQWLWLAPTGQLSSHVFTCGQGWRPSLAQWHALSRIEDLNQCLILSETQQQASPDHIVELDRALQRAAVLGCGDSADRITYALLAMSLGGPFENHDLMTDIFSQVTRNRASLAALADAVEQSVWDRIKSDLAPTRTHQKSGKAIQ